MKRKETIFLIVMAVLMVLAVVGVGYAAFSYFKQGSSLNVITSGIMQMSYEESSNVIKMTGALPTTDATGKVRLNEGEYFDFTVSSTITGDAMINWEIAAEDFVSNTFDGKNIKLYLTSLDSNGNETEVMAPKVFTKATSENKKTGRPANMMSLATGTMNASTSTKYRLRMYVTEEFNPQGTEAGKTFAVRINVYGKAYQEPTGSKMKAIVFDGTSPASYNGNSNLIKKVSMVEKMSNYDYSDISKIVTKNNNVVPSDAVYSEDVSEAGDGSVMAYVTSDNTLTIGGKDGIIAGDYVKFTNFFNVTSIDLTYVDTSKVINMSAMFVCCESLTNLDVSNFDTSKVTDMSGIFYGCSSLTNLDVSNFNTSSVTDMNDMFNGCVTLKTLDLSNFNTSKVTDMSGMFGYCGLTSLDLSNFNTSKVTNMSSMFNGCATLKTLDLSNFDTSSVTNMSQMFYDSLKLSDLNVSSFDTSKVTDMSSMFYNCDLTSLDLSAFDTSKVTDMSYMFAGSDKLTSVIVSSKWVIGSGCNTTKMFSGCGVSSVTVV